MKLRYYQEDYIKYSYDYINRGGKAGIAALPTGCHRKGQQVIMYDGSLKKVEDIVVGDVLLGPDSSPRIVTDLCRGRQEMREIIPKRFGESFVVNRDHILSLYKVKEGSDYPCQKPRIVNETVGEWEKSSKWHKHIHKLYHSNEVNFHNSVDLDIEPYLLGLLIGDGHMNVNFSFTSMDEELHNYVRSQTDLLGDTWTHYQKPNNKAWETRIHKGELRNKISNMGLWGKLSTDKYIPHHYKVSSIESRRHLLAGLLDSDGYIENCKGEITFSSEKLIDDTAFIMRSLGISVTKSKKWVVYDGEKRLYWRLYFYGDLGKIPFKRKLHKKKAKNRVQRSNVNCGFTVRVLPEEDYYGFTLTGDHLYLLDDFTVTHNSGKSLCIAELIKRTLMVRPNARFMMLTHVKELIEQNHEKLKIIWPSAPTGIYSAGVGFKQYQQPIIYGGIQSCYRRPEIFGKINVLIIDEAHLVSDKVESMYGAMIEGLKKTNPDLVIMGLTATPYRMGMGFLTNGPIFEDIYYDITTMESFVKLIDEGFLCPLVSYGTDHEMDVSNVKMRGGEFLESSLDKELNRREITQGIVNEVLQKRGERKKGLSFCISKDHAESMAAMYNEVGITSKYLHSDMSKSERESILDGFKSGAFENLTNVGIATTGLDVPDIDYIVLARPTQSTGLHVQILGRGLRPHPSKENTLVLDFAGNTMRLGPINDPVIPVAPGEKREGGEAPIKMCECGLFVPASTRTCPECGYEFKFEEKIKTSLQDGELIRRQDKPKIETYEVTSHSVLDYINPKTGNEVVRLNFSYVGPRGGVAEQDMYFTFAGRGMEYWHKLGIGKTPKNAKEAIEMISKDMKKPMSIDIWTNRKVNGKTRKQIIKINFEE